jgi:integrase
LESILKVASPEWRSLILFGLYTGQRLGDLATLTWDKLDLDHREIRLTTKKTARNQKIPINAHLLKHVRSLPKPDKLATPVHPNADSIFKAQGRSGMLSRQFYELMAKAGLVEKKLHRKKESANTSKQLVKGRSIPHDVSKISFHSLRHTTTSLLKNAGVSPAVAEEFVGHDSPEMNRVYTHIDQSSMRQAAEKLPDFTDVGEV